MRFRFYLGLAAVAAIALGSVLGAGFVRSHDRKTFEMRQDDEATRAARQAESFAAGSVTQLATAAAFFEAVEHLDRHKFQVMADSLLSGGAMSATGLIMQVDDSQRRRYERRRGIRIVDRSPLGLRPSPRRDTYYPLTFAASNSRITPPLGYDLGGEPKRAEALRRALRTGRPAATRVMSLPIGGTGFNVVRAIYEDGAPTATIAQRRRALLGFTIGSFDVNDLAGSAADTLDPGVDLELDEGPRTVAGHDLPSDSASTAVHVADRSWLLVVRDPQRPGLAVPLLIAVFGISISALLGALILVWSRNERMQELQRQASQDPLTGLKNRRRFEEDLRAELARSRRDGREGAVLMLDLDNFKRVNDTLGHAVGDVVIEDVGEVLAERLRETDLVARLGGDEFAAALPRCDAGHAEAVAEELIGAIREHRPEDGAAPAMTASVGIAMFGPRHGDEFDAVMERADAAMYAAKEAGRDGVRLAGEAMPEPQDAAR